MAKLGFDISTVEPQKAFDLLPKGDYVAQVVASEMQETKSGTGTMAKLEFDILEGEFAGRKLWARLNLHNQNAEAEKIGRAQFAQLAHAAGVPLCQDTSELHMKPVVIKVKIRQDKTGTYGDQNDISGYAAVEGKQMALPSRPPSAPAAKPWGRAA